MNWIYDDPTVPGWYATLHSWDFHEGPFPNAHYWNGQNWNMNRPIYACSPKSFLSREDAEKWAYANDPGG